MAHRFSNKISVLLLAIVLVVAVILRTYHIDHPLADWHSFRQADTASVTRTFVSKGIDVLHPTYHDLSNIQSGMENPSGYRMVEFPFMNAFSALIIRAFPSTWSEVQIGRWISILFSIGTLLCLYASGTMLSGKKVGLAAATVFAVMPYSVYYSRVIMPEPFMLFFIMASMTAFLWGIQRRSKVWMIVCIKISIISMALAILLKPFAALYLPMIFLGGWILARQKKHVIFAAAAFILAWIPFFLWRQWITHFPEGIPSWKWLINGSNLRFKGAYWHHVYEVHIGTWMLGIGGVALTAFGFLKKGKDWLVYLVGAMGVVAYLSYIAQGNIQHDYYQVITIPLFCLLMGRGLIFLWNKASWMQSVWISRCIGAGLFGFMLFVSWYNVRGFFNVNNWEFLHAGEAVDRLTPKDAKVIAPNYGDTAFLFQTKRSGWPIGFNIEERIQQGAQYYVTVRFDWEAEMLAAKYQTVEKTAEYWIIDLRNPIKTEGTK